MRGLAIRVLPAIVSLLLIVGTLAGYAWRALFDPAQFANRAAAALQDPGLRSVVAVRVTGELVRRHPDLLAVRPAVASVVSAAVGGDAFASLFRRGVRDVHTAVFRRDRDTVTLTVADAGVVVAEGLRVLRPELAGEIGAREPATLLDRHLGATGGDVLRLARRLRAVALVAALLALAAAAALLALAEDRRGAAARLGIAVAAAGAAIVVALAVARPLVLGRFATPDARDAAAAVWDAYLSDLRTTGWLLAASGAVLAAAARSLIRPVELEAPLRTAWRMVRGEPESSALRAVRGLALIAFGALLILEPSALLQAAVVLAGVYALYKGLQAILRLVNGPQGAEPPLQRPRLRWRPLAGAALATLIVAGLATAFAAGGADGAPAPAIDRCDGYAALCARPLDEVALPATHNAMSVPLPGWFAALQEHPIARQLADGIRGLLIDTHYADRLANGRTRTYFGGEEAMQRQIAQDGVSETSVEAALRLRERLGFRGSGERGVYLCHTFCELGSTPLADVLDDIRDFLVTHPGDVLVVINQDYVTPEDFVGAVDRAGLAGYALVPPKPGEPWPTLRQMVDSGRRLLVLAENKAGAAPWYQPVYQRLVQETPFSFSQTAQLTDPANFDASCRPNRGPEDAPLLLVNHWINTDPVPRPSNAAVVNADAPLLRRARACERVRHHPVNLLAVDFYERGDLFKVIDTLNGVR